MYQIKQTGEEFSHITFHASVITFTNMHLSIFNHSVRRACEYVKANAVELGIEESVENKSDINYCLVGHSSGANICALAVLHAATSCQRLVHSFVGFNGVYDIGKHFLFESTRCYLYSLYLSIYLSIYL